MQQKSNTRHCWKSWNWNRLIQCKRKYRKAKVKFTTSSVDSSPALSLWISPSKENVKKKCPGHLYNEKLDWMINNPYVISFLKFIINTWHINGVIKRQNKNISIQLSLLGCDFLVCRERTDFSSSTYSSEYNIWKSSGIYSIALYSLIFKYSIEHWWKYGNLVNFVTLLTNFAHSSGYRSSTCIRFNMNQNKYVFWNDILIPTVMKGNSIYFSSIIIMLIFPI